jgi:hypothetical protein
LKELCAKHDEGANGIHWEVSIPLGHAAPNPHCRGQTGLRSTAMPVVSKASPTWLELSFRFVPKAAILQPDSRTIGLYK